MHEVRCCIYSCEPIVQQTHAAANVPICHCTMYRGSEHVWKAVFTKAFRLAESFALVL